MSARELLAPMEQEWKVGRGAFDWYVYNAAGRGMDKLNEAEAIAVCEALNHVRSGSSGLKGEK